MEGRVGMWRLLLDTPFDTPKPWQGLEVLTQYERRTGSFNEWR